jgi:hypothetical protein
MATSNPYGHFPPWMKIEKKRNNARLVFNQTIAGHYRNGKTGYGRVGVLLLTWEADDMHLQRSEVRDPPQSATCTMDADILQVKRLESIFSDKFGYDTKNFEIPSEKSETALLHTVTEFVHEYNSPDNLMIVYYGGHGYEGTETQLFKLAALVKAYSSPKHKALKFCDSKLEADEDGDPTSFFDDIFKCLRLPQTDILFIIDCCFAARAFSTEGLGRRKYELIAAAAPQTKVPAAKHKDSFTRHLSDILEGMLEDVKLANGFSTSDLYRRVYHQRTDKAKPFLFDQSLHDYGRIWLRPHKPPAAQPPQHIEKPVTIRLSLKMTGSPTPGEINEMARALQYVPHVNEIVLSDLRYAPAEEVIELFQGMRRLVHVKRVIRKLQERIAAKKKQELESNAATPVAVRQLSLRIAPLVDPFQSPDWNKLVPILPVNIVNENVLTQSPISESSQRPGEESTMRRTSMAAVVLATIAKHDQEKQISEMIMWVLMIAVSFLIFAVHYW